MPRISFSDSNYAGLGTSITPFLSAQWFTSVTKVWNRHTFKTGFDFRRYDANSLNPGYSAGTFTFGTDWIRAASNKTAPPFGGSMADFLMGLPSGGQFDVNTGFAYRSYLFGSYLQDDWRIQPNLTNNAGIRFEHETPIAERYNRTVNGFDPAAVNAVAQGPQLPMRNRPSRSFR
jgi:hypothetical protein